jgi:gas vesicle protein
MSRTSDVVLAFVVGAAAGAVTALLLAPDKGSETRRKLRESIGDLAEKGTEALEAAGTGLRSGIHEISSAAKAQTGAVRAAVEAGKAYQQEMKKDG